MNQPALTITGSRGLPAWLEQARVSLVFSTYQAGKLFLVGLGPDGRLSIFERTLDRCMGVAATDQTLWVATRTTLWRFANALLPGQTHDGYDRVFVPQVGYTTGDVDVHDVALASEDDPVFVVTLFSCLGRCSATYSFEPVWQPPWITKLAAEDRCHLNGLALVDGKPKYVTSVSRADIVDGWREHRRGGGVVLDVETGEVVADGLTMPHSPRWHRDRLWLLQAGTGELGSIDPGSGSGSGSGSRAFEPLVQCPGFTRGLAFVDNFAVVGTSELRGDRAFADLPLAEQLRTRGAAPRCAVNVVDLDTGSIVAWLHLQGVVNELYDVAVLPGVRRPTAIGFRGPELATTITLPR